MLAVDKINMLLSVLMLHFITARRPLLRINTCIQDHLPTTGSSQSVAGPSLTFSRKVMIRIDSDTPVLVLPQKQYFKSEDRNTTYARSCVNPTAVHIHASNQGCPPIPVFLIPIFRSV